MAEFSIGAQDDAGNIIRIECKSTPFADAGIVDVQISKVGGKGYLHLGSLRGLVDGLGYEAKRDEEIHELRYEVARLGRLLHEARQDLSETGALETKSAPIDFARGWYGEDIAEALFDNDNRRLPPPVMVEVDVLTYPDGQPPAEALRSEARRG